VNETVYYDTCAFIYFFENRDKTLLHEYSPITRHEKGGRNIISPFVLEEYFHTYFTQKAATNEDRLERINKLVEIRQYKDFYFDVASSDINLNSLTGLYSSLFLAGTDLGIMTENKGDGNIHSNDLLHLSYCILAKADVFLTLTFNIIRYKSFNNFCGGFFSLR
jgi:hypothetical protein